VLTVLKKLVKKGKNNMKILKKEPCCEVKNSKGSNK